MCQQATRTGDDLNMAISPQVLTKPVVSFHKNAHYLSVLGPSRKTGRCLFLFVHVCATGALTAAWLERRSEQKQNHRQEEKDAEQKPRYRFREVLNVSHRFSESTAGQLVIIVFDRWGPDC